jgi:hypothetical protein
MCTIHSVEVCKQLYACVTQCDVDDDVVPATGGILDPATDSPGRNARPL